MTRSKKIVFSLIGATAAAAGITAFLIAPGRASKRKKAPFIGRNYAHRGLHRSDKSIPENSLAAFRAAVDNGYGIELDVQLSIDGQVIVFHDNTLSRLCGVDGPVNDRTLEELRTLTLCGTEERIPLLSEVFQTVGGRVPILIELKRGLHNKELCQQTLRLIDSYNGPVCVQSFDPFIVRWFKRNASDILRGQLSAPAADLQPGLSTYAAFLSSRLLTNFLCRPQFINYKIGKKPLLAQLASSMGAMKFSWVSHDWTSESSNDGVIFEYYRPRRHFK